MFLRGIYHTDQGYDDVHVIAHYIRLHNPNHGLKLPFTHDNLSPSNLRQRLETIARMLRVIHVSTPSWSSLNVFVFVVELHEAVLWLLQTSKVRTFKGKRGAFSIWSWHSVMTELQHFFCQHHWRRFQHENSKTGVLSWLNSKHIFVYSVLRRRYVFIFLSSPFHLVFMSHENIFSILYVIKINCHQGRIESCNYYNLQRYAIFVTYESDMKNNLQPMWLLLGQVQPTRGLRSFLTTISNQSLFDTRITAPALFSMCSQLYFLRKNNLKIKWVYNFDMCS